MITVLVIVLVLALIGGLPTWGYHQRGYGPSGLVGALLLVLVVCWLLGVFPHGRLGRW